MGAPGRRRVALDFRRLVFDFPPMRDRAQRLTATAMFGARVRRAEAALQGFDIGYTDGDHHVWREVVDVDVVRISNNNVEVAVDYLFRDSTGNIDDRYSGKVEVVVIADVA